MNIIEENGRITFYLFREDNELLGEVYKDEVFSSLSPWTFTYRLDDYNRFFQTLIKRY